jgi:CBS domain-containing protein
MSTGGSSANTLELFTVDINSTIYQALERIQLNKSRCVLVVERGKVLGTCSEGDVVRALLRGSSVYTPLVDVLNPAFIYLTMRDLAKAQELFARHLLSLIPIVDSEFQLKDVITLGDLLRELTPRSERHPAELDSS